MNKLMCILTGGHRYADKNIIVYQHPNPDYVRLHNECVKCGKTIEFDFCVEAYLRAGMTNFANIKNMNIKQMAKFLATLNGGGTVREEQFLRWLKEKKGGKDDV